MRNEPGRYDCVLKLIDYRVILSEKQLTPSYRKSVLQNMRAGDPRLVFIQAKIEQISKMTCPARGSVSLFGFRLLIS